MNRDFKLTLRSKMSYGKLQNLQYKPKNALIQIIYFVGVARTTEMPNRRTVVNGSVCTGTKTKPDGASVQQ